MTIAHTFGWRMKSEVLRLERRHIDAAAGTIRLDPSMTKNCQGRLVYMTPEVSGMLTQQLAALDELQRKLGRIIPHVFVHSRGRRIGQRRRSFVVPWREACQTAGCPGMYLHDFRRTAARDLVNGGVPETVHEDHRAQDALGGRSLPHREPGRPARGCPEARGHNFGHSGAGSGTITRCN